MTNTVNLWARLHEQQPYIMLPVLAKNKQKFLSDQNEKTDILRMIRHRSKPLMTCNAISVN